ncbi:MAG: hypothetical protein ACLUEQ_01925 [Cloacibacillus evryensis]
MIVLMGHGTPHHAANAMYSQLQLSLDKKPPDASPSAPSRRLR